MLCVWDAARNPDDLTWLVSAFLSLTYLSPYVLISLWSLFIKSPLIFTMPSSPALFIFPSCHFPSFISSLCLYSPHFASISFICLFYWLLTLSHCPYAFLFLTVWICLRPSQSFSFRPHLHPSTCSSMFSSVFLGSIMSNSLWERTFAPHPSRSSATSLWPCGASKCSTVVFGTSSVLMLWRCSVQRHTVPSGGKKMKNTTEGRSRMKRTWEQLFVDNHMWRQVFSAQGDITENHARWLQITIILKCVFFFFVMSKNVGGGFAA